MSTSPERVKRVSGALAIVPPLWPATIPLPMSERQCSSHRHPVSGLFGRLVPASLPRFMATCGAGPRLRVGSTLDGGPDWADGATRCQQGGGCLVACEVDGGVVVALVDGSAAVAGPVLDPADVLLVQALVAGL